MSNTWPWGPEFLTTPLTWVWTPWDILAPQFPALGFHGYMTISCFWSPNSGSIISYYETEVPKVSGELLSKAKFRIGRLSIQILLLWLILWRRPSLPWHVSPWVPQQENNSTHVHLGTAVLSPKRVLWWKSKLYIAIGWLPIIRQKKKILICAVYMNLLLYCFPLCRRSTALAVCTGRGHWEGRWGVAVCPSIKMLQTQSHKKRDFWSKFDFWMAWILLGSQSNPLASQPAYQWLDIGSH